MVHPAPTPGAPRSPSTNSEMSSSEKDAGSSQNEMLFMRGNAMSGAPIISGTIQLPKPPIIAGMTMKKIMISPCAVVNTLKVCGVVEELQAGMHQLEPHADGKRAADRCPPISANTRYIVPMSLWLVE